MIKKYKFIIIFIIFFSSKSFAFSPEQERKMYIDCYANSKVYLGSDKAKEYCLCTINKLSGRYSDQEIDLIFKRNSAEIIKATEFATIHCEKNKI